MRSSDKMFLSENDDSGGKSFVETLQSDTDRTVNTLNVNVIVACLDRFVFLNIS